MSRTHTMSILNVFVFVFVSYFHLLHLMLTIIGGQLWWSFDFLAACLCCYRALYMCLYK